MSLNFITIIIWSERLAFNSLQINLDTRHLLIHFLTISRLPSCQTESSDSYPSLPACPAIPPKQPPSSPWITCCVRGKSSIRAQDGFGTAVSCSPSRPKISTKRQRPLTPSLRIIWNTQKSSIKSEQLHTWKQTRAIWRQRRLEDARSGSRPHPAAQTGRMLSPFNTSHTHTLPPLVAYKNLLKYATIISQLYIPPSETCRDSVFSATVLT